MPIWVIILLISLCVTTVTGVYTLRHNRQNGHRNGNGHTVSQTISSHEQSSSGEPPLQGKKVILVPKIEISEEGEDNQESQPSALSQPDKRRYSHEEPHDHPEDHSPDPVIRERRRLVRHPRENEEDNEEDESESKSSAAPDVSAESTQAVSVEPKVDTSQMGAHEEWRQDEDIGFRRPSVQDTIVVKKDAESQTEATGEDKGVDAHPDMRDEEAQGSVARENRATQTKLNTRDIGTGEWLALQRSIGVGNPIETAEKGLGEGLKAEDRAIQANPTQEDKSVQEEPAKESKGIGSPPPSFHDKSLQIFPDREDEFMQVYPEHSNKSIQKDISCISIGLQPFNILTENKSVQAEEERISISLSSLLKLHPSFFLDEEESDLSKVLSPSLSAKLLHEDEKEDSFILHSLSSPNTSINFMPPWLEEIKLEESLEFERSKSLRGIQKSFHLSQLSFDESEGESPHSSRSHLEKSWNILDSEEEWSMIRSQRSFQTVKSEEMEEHLRQ